MNWPGDFINKIICGDCLEVMRDIPDESVDLIITSPPYNCGKDYEEELSDKEYYDFILPITKEWRRILKLEGRFAINVIFNINRIENDEKSILFPYIQWINALLKIKLKIKEDIIWDQLNSGCETAWGSWKSPSAPHIRHMTERIIVGYKNRWKLEGGGKSDLMESEFMKYTIDKWRFNSETDRKNHPAPFPLELPSRCMKLFSWIGATILDPFVGWGTTALAAKRLNRKFIGIDINPRYCKIAERRLAQEELF